MWWLLFLKCKTNKLGLVYTAGPTFLLYTSHPSLEKWILPLNPEGKKKKKKIKLFKVELKTGLKEFPCCFIKKV